MDVFAAGLRAVRLLVASFAGSLRPGATALCTELADKLHGPLTPREVHYSRRVTAAWALFFAAIVAITVVLFAAAPLRVWSLFANFCILPLVALMFTAEYAVRCRVLPQALSAAALWRPCGLFSPVHRRPAWRPLPLLSHDSPTAVLAYRDGNAIDAQQFLADAVRLAESLPRGGHVLNVCLDRYQFTVGLAACLISGRISLLPSTHAPEVVRQLLQFAPDAFCLTDDARCDIELPRFVLPASNERTRRFRHAWRVPQIPASQVAAIVFTSGSTGTPLPYRKTWGRLSRCLRGGAGRLGLPGGSIPTLIGTVPPQHMYGFESTVLLALFSGCAFIAERPFYPADICASISAAPRPRALVSTPIHLRTLLGADIELPPLDLILSATAPLGQALAREAERRFRGRLVEIYGSTETGQIATRRTADSLIWRLLPEVRLSADGDATYAHGGHVEQFTRCATSSNSPASMSSYCTAAPPTWSTWPASAARSPI